MLEWRRGLIVGKMRLVLAPWRWALACGERGCVAIRWSGMALWNGSEFRELWPWPGKAMHEGFSGCYVPCKDSSQPMTHSQALFGMAHLSSVIIAQGQKSGRQLSVLHCVLTKGWQCNQDQNAAQYHFKGHVLHLAQNRLIRLVGLCNIQWKSKMILWNPYSFSNISQVQSMHIQWRLFLEKWIYFG